MAVDAQLEICRTRGQFPPAPPKAHLVSQEVDFICQRSTGSRSDTETGAVNKGVAERLADVFLMGPI